MVDDMNCPNGLAFSPDESLLYVADTGRMFFEDPAAYSGL
jgi:gluconolactonase